MKSGKACQGHGHHARLEHSSPLPANSRGPEMPALERQERRTRADADQSDASALSAMAVQLLVPAADGTTTNTSTGHHIFSCFRGLERARGGASRGSAGRITHLVNMRCWCWTGMPGPVSSTASTSTPSSARRPISLTWPRVVNFNELETRFEMTWSQ